MLTWTWKYSFNLFSLPVIFTFSYNCIHFSSLRFLNQTCHDCSIEQVRCEHFMILALSKLSFWSSSEIGTICTSIWKSEIKVFAYFPTNHPSNAVKIWYLHPLQKPISNIFIKFWARKNSQKQALTGKSHLHNNLVRLDVDTSRIYPNSILHRNSEPKINIGFPWSK